MKIRPLRIKRRIRYEIEFSNVRYAEEVPEASESDEEENIERMTSRPCDALVPNNDGHAKGYPLRFICADFEDGCIHYALTTGSCKTALRFPHVRKDRLVSCTLKKGGEVQCQ
jgi:hypothetical protein